MPNLFKYIIISYHQIKLLLLTFLNILVNLDKLLFPIPKPSTIELFLLIDVPDCERLDILTLSVALTSWPNSAPITPINITAVVCLRRNSLRDDGFLKHKSVEEKKLFFILMHNIYK